MKTNLSDNYTTGENKYPATLQETFHYLEKHSKNSVRAQTATEGSSFAQKGGASKHWGPPKDWDDKEWWKENHVLTVAKKDTHHATDQMSGNNANRRKIKRQR